MQRLSGRLLLPEPGWRRFRLPNLPEEVEARPTPGRGQRRVVAVVLWLGVSITGAELTRPSADAGLLTLLDPTAIWSGLRAGTSNEPHDGEPGVSPAAQRAASAPAKNAATPQVPSEPAAPPRVVAGLAPIARQSPATHQGAQFSLPSNLPSGFEARLEQVQSALEPERAGGVLTAEQRLPVRDRATELLPSTDDASRVVPRVWTQRGAQGCEQAHAAYQETLDMAAAPATPDVSREAFAERLENFSAYARCDLDQPRDISICVAVQGGSAKGVTVKTEPRDARLAACIVEAVSRIRFPSSPRMDLVRSELTVR